MMQSEPTIIIGLVRAVLAVLVAFGIDLTQDQQVSLITLTGAVIAVVSLGLTYWNRQSVFSPETVNRLLEEQAEPPVDPPAG
jgi:hypothetical protein